MLDLSYLLQPISYNSARGGISQITERGDTTASFLLVQPARFSFHKSPPCVLLYLYVCICFCVFVYLCICSFHLAFTRLIDSGLYSCQPSVGDLKSVTVHVIRSESLSSFFSLSTFFGFHKEVTVHVIRSETIISFFPSHIVWFSQRSGLDTFDLIGLAQKYFLVVKSIWFCDCKWITYFRTRLKFVDFESFPTSIFIGKCKYFVLMQLFPPVNLSRPIHTLWRKTYFQKKIKWAAC